MMEEKNYYQSYGEDWLNRIIRKTKDKINFFLDDMTKKRTKKLCNTKFGFLYRREEIIGNEGAFINYWVYVAIRGDKLTKTALQHGIERGKDNDAELAKKFIEKLTGLVQ
jgi:hypothetical protein